ncbi:hypothetical protein IBX73_01305 [candidate division WOR-3 bacterium]|nr:hypothetical protein [candidate division WOR-3 bacterium]
MRIVILALMLLSPLVAHPPKSIELEYDIGTGILTVEVVHGVSDASKHYVNEVEVELNGTKLIEQSFRSQIDKEKQQVFYKVIDAKVGDKFTVEAYCNISGKRKAQLEVTTTKSSE